MVVLRPSARIHWGKNNRVITKRECCRRLTRRWTWLVLPKRPMLLWRMARWHGPFCFLVDVNGSEASLCSLDYALLIMKKIIFYYIMYKYVYVWYLFINKQHSSIHEHIYVWSWLHTNIKELIHSQTYNPLYALSIEPSLFVVTSSYRQLALYMP
jgi:hypothetical protein